MAILPVDFKLRNSDIFIFYELNFLLLYANVIVDDANLGIKCVFLNQGRRNSVKKISWSWTRDLIFVI